MSLSLLRRESSEGLVNLVKDLVVGLLGGEVGPRRSLKVLRNSNKTEGATQKITQNSSFQKTEFKGF